MFLIAFGGVGVILLLRFLFTGSTKISPGSQNAIAANLDESTFTIVRLFLIGLEFLWLSFWAIFYIRLSMKATQPASEDTKKKIEAFEPKYFQLVAALLVLLLILSFAIPYIGGDEVEQFHNHTNDQPFDKQVNILAHQFYFEFDVNNNGTYVQSFSKDNPEVVLKTNVMYLFSMKTTDTTHGFGLYSPDGVLLGQNQIVPGYDNYYYFQFEKPGIYKVLCMEYCGAGHQVMVSYIQVV